MSDIASVILAAGEGVRMKSELPKVLNAISGRPMIEYVLDSVLEAGCDRNYVIIGHKKDEVISKLEADGYNGRIEYIEQEQLLGSGHAVLQAKGALGNFDGNIIITCGDIPLQTSKTLKELAGFHLNEGNSATVLVAEVDDPFGYGRVITRNGRAVKIVEEKDATRQERLVNKINTGIYCFLAGELFNALDKVTPDNKKKEYYLTDVIKIMSDERKKVGVVEVEDSRETMGVNTREQLAIAESCLKEKR